MRIIFLSMTILGLFTFSEKVVAESGETECGATIITPLMIMAWEEMEFGTIAPSTTRAGKVEITFEGARNCSNGLSCLVSDFRAGRFAVIGESEKVYTIDLPNEATMYNTSGDAMLISAFHADRSGGILINGKDEFWLGGTLDVSANQAEGRYIGNFIVSVEYQ